MARHLDKFTKPFETSGIAFLLAEVITNGAGEMVDILCRFLNSPAAALLDSAQDALQGQRFTRVFSAEKLSALTPLSAVAFSGSALTFSYTTVLGRPLNITCYQPMYGLAACILEEQRRSAPIRDVSRVLSEQLPGAAAVLELSRRGVRNLSFNRRLCQLSGYDRKEFLLRFSEDFSALVAPSDWSDLLQALLDSARDGHAVNHPFRLLRKTGEPLWMELRAEPLPGEDGDCVFHAALLDVDSQTRDRAALAAAQSELASANAQLSQVFDTLPCGYCILRLTPDHRLKPVRVNRRLSELLGYPPGKFLTAFTADPLWCVLPEDREALCAAAHTRTAGASLRQTVRARRKDGSILFLRLEAAWQPAEDGAALLYAACFDATQERETQDILQSRSALCELLLSNSNTVCLDYTVSSGAAQIECATASGVRDRRIVPDYLNALETLPNIHADDRKVVAANLQQLSAKPGAVSFIYRGNYDGQGWRWYQASCLGLPDAGGGLCRVLGKAEDVSERMSAAERFHERSVRQGRAMAALCRRDYHLVLTVDTETGHCQYLGGRAAPPGDRYQNLGGPPLESIRAALETAPCYTCTSSPEGLCLRFSWLNKSRKLILVTASLSE